MMTNPPNKSVRFRGIRLPAGYDQTLREAVEQDQKDPEDANQPEVQNQISRKWGGSFNG